MHKLALFCGVSAISIVTGCLAPSAEDRANAAADAPDDVATSTATAASFAFFPMGFIRVSSSGGALVAFSSSGGLVSPARLSTGAYQVTFGGLGASLTDAAGGNVQLVAETTTNARCRLVNWSGAPNVVVNVQCVAPNGTPVDAGFAVQFFRYTMPAPNANSTSAAYTWITSSGGVSPFWDYNSSGTHNTVTKTTGNYTIRIPGATVDNASMMVSTYGTDGGSSVACSVVGWGAGNATVQCRNSSNVLVDNAFSFSYSWSGPTLSQQGGHAWFDGSAANSFYSSALGKITGCSATSVTGTRSGSLVTLKVIGDLGPWDASPFVRASFASFYGQGGYCNVQAEFATGSAPSSTGTTILQCYDATGAVVATPLLTFTHVTSDASGPC